MTAALYRRYRPQSFQEVIGQDHVTLPLMAALRGERTNHAYLFSGPRGCGKTTSARILARCLNCAKGPTDTPCGTCESCQELAREGAGSLDVVELDAASHGGVDHARDLREMAGFAPVRDRYKIFIIDEAHMVSNQGFNALLKLVEEPPKHVKFIFATTEPEKVIGTIRSRTHHYPFRLVPPDLLENYLLSLCEAENISAGPGVLPLVIRAGGGSVRDTLSVLDQLMGGQESGQLHYDAAVALLGFTDDALLDDTVQAISANDGAAIFKVIDRVINSGHDPRRFMEDLLQRMRDLIVLSLAGEHATQVLHGTPELKLAAMQQQAQYLGSARASKCADLLNEALLTVAGAVSPRLNLELLCARMLVNLNASSLASTQISKSPQNSPQAQNLAPAQNPTTPIQNLTSNLANEPKVKLVDSSTQKPTVQPAPQTNPKLHLQSEPPIKATAASQENQQVSSPAQASENSQEVTTQSETSPNYTTHTESELIRNRWPEVLANLRQLRVSTWSMISQYAQVSEINGNILHLAFQSEGICNAFNRGNHAQVVSQALATTLGYELTVQGTASAQTTNSNLSSTIQVTDYEPTNTSLENPNSLASTIDFSADGPTMPSAVAAAHNAWGELANRRKRPNSQAPSDSNSLPTTPTPAETSALTETTPASKSSIAEETGALVTPPTPKTSVQSPEKVSIYDSLPDLEHDETVSTPAANPVELITQMLGGELIEEGEEPNSEATTQLGQTHNNQKFTQNDPKHRKGANS